MFRVCRRTCPWLTFCLWGTAVCLSRKCGRCVQSVYRLCRASDPPTFSTPYASHPTHWPSTPMGTFASWSSSVVSLQSECAIWKFTFFFFTLSIKNWISYRKGLFELVREQLYGDVFNQSACFFVVFFNGGYTTLTKKWVFFISGKKELMVQWWPSVHSEDGVGESSWAHWWVTKLLPSSCITESSSYFRTICALNMADLYQYLKSPQNNSNAVFTQCSSIKHRRSDIMIYSLVHLFHIGLFWCKPTMN